MPHLGDFLIRFKPAGAPGAAALAGVPADRKAELIAEVGPVLARLAATEAEYARIAAEADRRAHEIAQEAAGQAARIMADGRARAQAVRGEAAAAVFSAARTRAAQIERNAAERAQARDGPADDAVRALIADAVRLVLATAGGSQTAAPTRDGTAPSGGTPDPDGPEPSADAGQAFEQADCPSYPAASADGQDRSGDPHGGQGR